MEVDVKVHGASRPQKGGGALRMELRDDVSAGDLLRELGERYGDTFRRMLGALPPGDRRLPRHIRMFVDGEMLATLDQPLGSATHSKKRQAGGADAGVTVVVLTPMMGG